MNWSDYEAVWKRQESPRGEKADVASLRATFEAKHRKMAAAYLVRDFGEAGAGVFVSVVLGFVWKSTGVIGWPIALAVLLTLGVAGVFVRERLRTRRLRVPADAPLLAKVAADTAQLRRQLGLYRWIWAWYLGPILAALVLVHAALCLPAPPWDPRRDPLFNAGFLAFYLATVWFAGWGIRRTVRRQLEPRLAELEKLQRELAAAD